MIDTNELYNLKYSICEFVLPRLKEFKEIYIDKRSPTIPTIYREEIENSGFNKKELNFNESEELWIQILEDIILAFELQINEEKFSELDSGAIKNKTKRGLNLFAKYFQDLWI